jgi:hypothetical protein
VRSELVAAAGRLVAALEAGARAAARALLEAPAAPTPARVTPERELEAAPVVVPLALVDEAGAWATLEELAEAGGATCAACGEAATTLRACRVGGHRVVASVCSTCSRRSSRLVELEIEDARGGSLASMGA